MIKCGKWMSHIETPDLLHCTVSWISDSIPDASLRVNVVIQKTNSRNKVKLAALAVEHAQEQLLLGMRILRKELDEGINALEK